MIGSCQPRGPDEKRHSTSVAWTNLTMRNPYRFQILRYAPPLDAHHYSLTPSSSAASALPDACSRYLPAGYAGSARQACAHA